MIFSLLLLCAISMGYELRAVQQDHDYTSMVEVDSADILRMKRKLDDMKGDEESNFKHQKSGRQRRKPEDSELRTADVLEELYEDISSDVTKTLQKRKVKKAVKVPPKETLHDVIIPDETESLQARKSRNALAEVPEEKPSQPNQKQSNINIQQQKRELKTEKIPEKTAAPRISRSNKQKSKVNEELLDENYVVQYDDTCIDDSDHNDSQIKPRSIIQKQGSDNTFQGQEDLPNYNEDTAIVQGTETRKTRHLNPALAGIDIKTEKSQRQKSQNEKQEHPKRSLYDEEEGFAIDEMYEDEIEKRKSHEGQSKQRKSRNSNNEKKEIEFQNQDHDYREMEK